jgi:hypothetical protein
LLPVVVVFIVIVVNFVVVVVVFVVIVVDFVVIVVIVVNQHSTLEAPSQSDEPAQRSFNTSSRPTDTPDIGARNKRERSSLSLSSFSLSSVSTARAFSDVSFKRTVRALQQQGVIAGNSQSRVGGVESPFISTVF